MSLPDLATFLDPIRDDAPTGESLRFDPLYDEVRKLREQDDATLPQGVWQRELKKADWAGVSALCTEALKTRSKDLQLAAWLLESWIPMYGFAGVGHGMRLLAALCAKFWDGLYPPLDEESPEARIAPIVWISEKLELPVKSIPITAPAGEDGVSYAWRHWEEGQYLQNLTKTNAAAAAKERAMVPLTAFNVSVSMTPATWFAKQATDLAEALTAVDALDRLLIEKTGEKNAPSLAPIRNALASIGVFVGRVYQERVDKGEVAPAVTAVATAIESAPFEEAAMEQAALPAAAAGPIVSRADAYQRLRDASEYLMRTEPHSPVPYLVRRAISWGNMSLAELLEELLRDRADLPTVYTLLGIRKS